MARSEFDLQPPLGKPWDYPLGSLESRAAARAMVDAQKAEALKRQSKTPVITIHWVEVGGDCTGTYNMATGQETCGCGVNHLAA